MRVQRNALLLVAAIAALTVALARGADTQRANEHRYLPDEVVVEVANSVSAAQIDALQRRFRLTRIESHTFQLSGTTLLRWRIPDGRSVTAVAHALEQDARVAFAQPNYLFAPQAHAIAKK